MLAAACFTQVGVQRNAYSVRTGAKRTRSSMADQ
jgi:hypothetical protein